MDHFAIVQALCRAALAQSPTPALRRQVERLRDALRGAGAHEQALAVASLLDGHPRASELAPSRLVRSALAPAAEVLTPRTPVPVDKESGNALAEVLFPDDLPLAPPIFAPEVAAAAAAVVAEWRGADRLRAGGFPPARTCLVFGPPGTGKTHLALWLARQVEMPVVLARLDGLISSLLGTTSRNIAALFGFAARYACVLLLDEFDAIAKLRDDPQEVGEIKRVVNTLLQHLDARREAGLTVGVTNHEGLLDPAVWRRFDVQIGVGAPGDEARAAIARAYFGPSDPGAPLLRVVSWLTAGASGADIEGLVTAVRKRLLLADGAAPPLLAVVAECATLYGGRTAAARARALGQPPRALARVLADEVGLGPAEVGDLLGHDRATIYRWLRDSDDNGVRPAGGAAGGAPAGSATEGGLAGDAGGGRARKKPRGPAGGTTRAGSPAAGATAGKTGPSRPATGTARTGKSGTDTAGVGRRR